jgi:hypothetical protein
LIELSFNFLIKKNNKFLAFSLSWLFPILLICLLGLFHIDLPIYFLALIAGIDFSFFFLINIYKKVDLSWKKIFFGYVAGSVIIGLSNIQANYIPWLSVSNLAYANIVPDDALRDAAVVHAWSEYSSISHGIHGLLFEPYHVLFAIFIDPFISDSVNVIQVFTILANIIVPTLIIYGCSKLIIYMGFSYISNNWLIVLFFFILTFSSFSGVLHQRSLLIATLLYISVIPLIFNIITDPKSNHFEIILLSLLVPVSIFARAFHGLFLLGLLFYFLLIKKISKKIIILASIVFSALFLVLYFGQTDRSLGHWTGESGMGGGIGFGYFQYILYSTHTYVSVYIIPVILFLLFIIFRRKLLNFNISRQSTNERFLFFIIFACILTLIFTLRSSGYSDVYYQLVPFCWLIFFFLITPQFKALFFSSKDRQMFFKNPIFKFFIVILLFIVSVSFVREHFISIYSKTGTPKSSVMKIRKLNGNWNYGGDNKFLINDINTDNCEKIKFDFFCEVRAKIFGVSNLNEFILNLHPAKMLSQAKILSSNLKGTTAVYISPDNSYWSFFTLNGGRHLEASLYFMALGKLPLIFGAHPDSRTPTYSMNTAHNNSGTLKNLNSLGGDKNLCSYAKNVDINNIIIFEPGIDPRTLKCK